MSQAWAAVAATMKAALAAVAAAVNNASWLPPVEHVDERQQEDGADRVHAEVGCTWGGRMHGRLPASSGGLPAGAASGGAWRAGATAAP